MNQLNLFPNLCLALIFYLSLGMLTANRSSQYSVNSNFNMYSYFTINQNLILWIIIIEINYYYFIML